MPGGYGLFGAWGLGVLSSGLWSWGAGGLASPGCPGTRPVRKDLESVQTVSASLAGMVLSGAWGPVGGECSCAVGDCRRVCGLIAALRQGSVMLGSVWDAVCTLCSAVRGIAAWSLFEDGLFLR